jgi:hypothetical protein
MDIVFDRGSEERPKGHALLYFRNSSDPDEVWVTYMVILPISVDVSKYVPPFLMDQVGQIGPKELSAFAFPPAPERLGSYDALQELAAKRDDDILYAGSVNPTDVPSAMMSINEAVQWYSTIYGDVVGIAGQADEDEADEEDSGLGVTDVLYGLMSETDKLGELTKLVGRLKFAVDGADAAQITEAEAEVGLLSRHLPDNHNVAQLIEAVKSSDRRGAELADLYLQRCYHLVHEDYAELARIEAQLKDVQEQA